MKLRLRTPKLSEPPPKRGEVSEFSDSSRRRMLELLSKLLRDRLPLFVSLTYPDSFPSYRETFKRDLEVFCQRLLRKWPLASVLWKLEFKERLSGENKGKVAPHYHLFVYGVPALFPFQPERRAWYRLERKCPTTPANDAYWMEFPKGEEPRMTYSSAPVGAFCWANTTNGAGESVPSQDTFLRWVSRTWYDVVGSGDLRHYRAGTRVEVIESWQKVCGYAAKRYLSKKEFLPQLQNKPGRFWGVIGRANLPLGEREELDLTEKQGHQLRRFFRRYRRSITKPEKRHRLRLPDHGSREFSMKLFCDADLWRARIWALVGDQPDAYELPEHRSALAELLHHMASDGRRLCAVPATLRAQPMNPPPATSWLAASNPEP